MKGQGLEHVKDLLRTSCVVYGPCISECSEPAAVPSEGEHAQIVASMQASRSKSARSQKDIAAQAEQKKKLVELEMKMLGKDGVETMLHNAVGKSLMDLAEHMRMNGSSEPYVILASVMGLNVRLATRDKIKKSKMGPTTVPPIEEVAQCVLDISSCQTMPAMEKQLLDAAERFNGTMFVKRPFIAAMRGDIETAIARMRQLLLPDECIELITICGESVLQPDCPVQPIIDLTKGIQLMIACQSRAKCRTLLEQHAAQRIGLQQTAMFLGEEAEVVATPRIPENVEKGQASEPSEVKKAKKLAKEERNRLRHEQDGLLTKYFSRFDYDNTGVVAGEDELGMLCTSLCVKLHLAYSPEQISVTVKRAAQEMGVISEWNYEAFAKFFKHEFLEDEVDSDSNAGEQIGAEHVVDAGVEAPAATNSTSAEGADSTITITIEDSPEE